MPAIAAAAPNQRVLTRDRRELTRREHEQARDEHRLGDASLAVLGRLERLARLLGEAVEVEAVVPVGPPDERQAVRTEPVERVLHRAMQVLEQRPLAPGRESNGTSSSRIDRSPVSFRYAATASTSHNGSSLKPEPIASLPRFVSGWYW